MNLIVRIKCKCGRCYHLDQNASVKTIVCPNCGYAYPESKKLLSILSTAREIKEDDLLSTDACASFISEWEYMKNAQ